LKVRSADSGSRPPVHRSALPCGLPDRLPDGFTVGQLVTKVHTMTGLTSYTVRQAAYDLRKLRGKGSSTNTANHADTTYHPTPYAPSPPCSPSATT
jgi:hypothetical protein